MAEATSTSGATGRIAGRCRSLVRATIGLLVLCVAVIALVPGIAHAASADNPVEPPPAGSGQVLQSWGFAPSGVDPSQPSSRPSFNYELAPGSSTEDSATLWNFSNVQVTFDLYATDAYNNEQGDFTLLPSDIAAKEAGTWIKLSTNAVTVDPSTSVVIPFTITVPADASPGDHTAGMLAAVPTSTVLPSGQQVPIDRRTGSRVYVRVAGPVNPSLTVENLSGEYHSDANPLGGSFDVSYTLRNNGNIRLGARQVVKVKDVFGRTVEERRIRALPELLPGNEFTVETSFDGVPALIRLTAEVELEPFAPQGVNEDPPEKSTASSATWAIPWTLLVLLVVGLVGWRLQRRYRERQPVARSTPALDPRLGGRGV